LRPKLLPVQRVRQNCPEKPPIVPSWGAVPGVLARLGAVPVGLTDGIAKVWRAACEDRPEDQGNLQAKA